MKLRVVLITLLLLTPLTPSISATPPKAGAICSKAGITKNYKGKKFSCIKSGKKLVWNKGVVIKVAAPTPTPSPTPTPAPTPTPTTTPTPTATSTPTPTPTPSPLPTPTPNPTPTQVQNFNDVYSGPSVSSDKIESCRIREANLNGPRNGRAGPEGALIPLPSGFPIVTPATQRVGTVKWALIPIEFSDLRGESNFSSRVNSQMELLSEWFFTVSENQFKVEWSVHSDWVTLPKPSSQYAIERSMNLIDSPIGQTLFSDAMASADPVFDFTNIQYVIFLLPKGQTFLKETAQGFPWDKIVIETKTKEGKVSGFAMAGVFMDQPNKDYWGYWAHEFGHGISLAHIGRSLPPAALFAGFDLMASQDGPTRDLSGWLRFLAQWLPEDRVYCKELKEFNELEVTLVPLNSREKGLKLIVIPLSTTKALVIESRRDTKFSCQMSPSQNGVLVYIYDATLSHGEDFLIPISPEGRLQVQTPCPVPPMFDSVLRTTDKISVEGLIVQNMLSGKFDKIRITKK